MFTICYEKGEERSPDIPRGKEFISIPSAVGYCKEHGIPIEVVRIIEWDAEIDAYGVEEIVGQCNLAEAHHEGYETLSFY